MGQSCDKIQIITIPEMLTQKKRLDVRLSFEVLKSADKQKEVGVRQITLNL